MQQGSRKRTQKWQTLRRFTYNTGVDFRRREEECGRTTMFQCSEYRYSEGVSVAPGCPQPNTSWRTQGGTRRAIIIVRKHSFPEAGPPLFAAPQPASVPPCPTPAEYQADLQPHRVHQLPATRYPSPTVSASFLETEAADTAETLTSPSSWRLPWLTLSCPVPSCSRDWPQGQSGL